MLLKRFYLNLAARMLLILINMLGLAIAIRDLMESQKLFTFIVLTGILLFQMVLLFTYLKKTDRLLTKIVLAISNRDFSLRVDRGKGKTPHQELSGALNAILDQHQSLYMEKESQSFMIHHLVKAIPAGILVANEEGELLMKNQEAERFLNLKGAGTIREMERLQPEFYRKIIEPGIPGNYTFHSTSGGDSFKLSVHIKEFILLKNVHQIILIQDISKEVDAGEVDAIKHLLRILTHEIMNSLTPVQSLTETITMLMTEANGKPKEQKNLSKNFLDILESVQAIKERAGGLDHFVNKFRTLTQMSESIETEWVPVRMLFESVCKILNTQLEPVEVSLELENAELSIKVDQALMEQVLINLITNSITAMSSVHPAHLTLKAFRRDNLMVLQVLDNGAGIPQEKIAHIFMPFYSTKQKASGIGLSFVKQALRLHNGSIQAQSSKGQGCTFTITLPEHSLSE